MKRPANRNGTEQGTPGRRNPKDKRVSDEFGRAASPDEAEEMPAPEQSAQDVVEEASMESFPASDPPGYGPGHG